MSRVQTHAIIAIVVLSLFIGVTYLGASSGNGGKEIDMAQWLPRDIGEWNGQDLDPQEEWKDQLPAARFMVRLYSDGGALIDLLMIESADPGSFHSPMFCLPGAGWTPKEAGTAKLRNGEVSKAEFVKDFSTLVVRYWYLAGDKLTASLWHHKWNMLVNKISGTSGPNFSFRITVRQPGERKPEEAANEFAEEALQAVRQKLASSRDSASL